MLAKRRSPVRPLWLRFVAALILAIFASSVSLAWVMLTRVCCAHTTESTEASAPTPPKTDGCCPGDSNEERASTDDDHDDAPCSCPIDCGSRCSGMPASVLWPTAPLLETTPATGIELTFASTFHSPAVGVHRDLLRVPKRSTDRS